MIARKMTPNEYWRANMTMAVAFEDGFDMEKERAKERKDEGREDYWGAFAENGPDGGKTPVASLIMNLYDVRFDGHIVKMGGVGGVASLPPFRRGGAVRACMNASLRDLYHRGYVFSMLYPFSTAFYRKFGYENAALCHLWEVPLNALPKETTGGRVYQLFPGDDLSPLLEVYRQVYGGMNMGALREKYDPGLAEKNLLEEKRYIFVWEDETGRPGAFLIGGRDGETLNCRTDFSQRNGFLFRDARALTALLSFVQTSFISNFEKIRFTVPGHMDICGLIPEAAEGTHEFFFNGMIRVVDAQRALKLCRCKGQGRLTVQVTDPVLEENNGTFRLTFAPGAENNVERVQDEPDITVGAGELGQLLAGVKGAEDLPWMVGASVKNAEAPLENVFYRKPCHILDLF